ncbi:MAG TPA: hypothetical protein DCG75_01595 [Bacteroidales bacterium]|jgi:hypothetical protein|nr:hypothetical protein [Bacteroidales bacterium]
MTLYKTEMKTYRAAIAVLFILFAIACNNKQKKENVANPTDVVLTTSEISITKNTDYIDQDSLLLIENTVKEILITSPRYTQFIKGLNEKIIKNGGTSFNVILERSPNQNSDNEYIYSKTYDFVIYENYTDRRLSTARFSFNPENKQLYEYDAVSDQLKPIEFDRDLIIRYDSVLINQ